MARDNTTRQKVYAMFLQGASVEETTTKLKLKHHSVKLYFTDFIIKSARLKNDKEDRVAQITAIEQTLFSLYASKVADSRILTELEHVYVHYNALK